MSVFKLHKNGNYTHMSTFHLRDKRLTWQAKGMLSFMYSNSDTFEYSIEGLAHCAENGVTSVKSIIKELKDFGYLQVYAVRNPKGQVIDWQYDIYERPEDCSPDSEKPDVENPHVDNQGQSNNNISNDSNSNTPYSRITYIESSKEKEKIIKERKYKESPQLDYSFIEDEWKDAFREWVMYKIERKEMYKTQRTLVAAYRQLKECSMQNPSNAILVVTQSIGNNYKGLFPIKNYGKTSSTTINGNADNGGTNNASAAYRAISEECGRVLEELFRQG